MTFKKTKELEDEAHLPIPSLFPAVSVPDTESGVAFIAASPAARRFFSLSLFFGYYLFSAALAFSASTANAAGSEIASSDSILRLMSMPATFRPLISLE